jgi:cellulose synthase (UDP-forming)
MKPRSNLLPAFLLFALLALCVVLLIPLLGQALVQTPAVENRLSIAELAANYYGALSRPLFPEVSLGLPLWVQGIVSLGFVLVTVFVVRFMPTARRLMMALAVAMIARHLLWRGFETLDFSTPLNAVVNVLIYGAEIVAFFSLLLGYFQMFGQTQHRSFPIDAIAPDKLPSVDVFVCTYNEPVSVLYRTMVGCQSMAYPNMRVFLCDDGNRPEMAALAEKLGVLYMNRPSNEHAKAGNLNNAMAKTDSDLVVVFDADHVPSRNFLQEVVGFFLHNPKLAFVQTPQHFFTPDPFQRNLMVGNVINNEQDLFFHVIQPGNDYWGATFFAGSGAIFRRSALKEIGGFAVETITEDTHTGMRLHAKGWESLFYNRDLAAGLSQDSFHDFVRQRLRWARGMTQIFLIENPLFVRGLNLAQRLCYLSGIWYFFHGLPRLVFLAAPLVFLLLGVKTINAGYVEVLIYYLPSFLALSIGYSVISRGIRQSFWSEVYETATCTFLSITTFLTVLSPKRAHFQVTPKGTITERMSFNFQIVVPQLVLILLTVIGIGLGVLRAYYTPEYIGGIYTNMFWAVYNLILLLAAVYVAQERPQFRLAPRVSKRVRCELRLLDGTIAVGETLNISESGVSAVFDEVIPLSGTMMMKLLDWDIDQCSVVTVQAMRSQVNRENRLIVGFNVVERTDLQHQQLIRHMFGNADVWNHDHTYTPTAPSFVSLLTTPIRLNGGTDEQGKRRSSRFSATLSCVLEVDGKYYICYSQEMSESGISIHLKDARLVKPQQVARLRIQWSSGQVADLSGQIVRVEEADATGHHKVGMNFVNLTREQRLAIIRQLYRPKEGLVRVAPTVQRSVPCVLNLENGSTVRVVTHEISEMGAVVSFDDSVPGLPNDAKGQLQMHWSDDRISIYPVVIKGTQDARKLALLYFDNLDLKTLDTLSAEIHQPLMSKGFQSLNSA